MKERLLWLCLRFPLPRRLRGSVTIAYLNSMPIERRQAIAKRWLHEAFPEFARFERCWVHNDGYAKEESK